MHIKDIKKIAIVGCAGSGKTTLASKLSKTLNLPLYHLDKYYWLPNWKRRNHDEFKKIHRDIYLRDEWIIDGNQTRTIKERLQHADMVIFLDRSRWLCLWRAFTRWLFNRHTSRSDLIKGCKDRITWGFYRYIWVFPRDYRPKVTNTLQELSGPNIVVLRSDSEISNFFNTIKSQL